MTETDVHQDLCTATPSDAAEDTLIPQFSTHVSEPLAPAPRAAATHGAPVAGYLAHSHLEQLASLQHFYDGVDALWTCSSVQGGLASNYP